VRLFLRVQRFAKHSSFINQLSRELEFHRVWGANLSCESLPHHYQLTHRNASDGEETLNWFFEHRRRFRQKTSHPVSEYAVNTIDKLTTTIDKHALLQPATEQARSFLASK